MKEALSIRADDQVLSITSGGDNTLALLLLDPQKVTSIDLNAAQNYLLELKIAAAQTLSYIEYLEFLGVGASKRRKTLFEKVRPRLSDDAKQWWSTRDSLLAMGVIHCGRFERFIAWFAHYGLPFIHSRKTRKEFLSVKNLNEQKVFYREQWDSKRWRLLFGLVSNRLMLRRFARQHGMFKHTEGLSVADVYRKRLVRNLNHVFIQGNFFLHYSLAGEYGSDLPPYLQENGYLRLREVSASKMLVETGNLLNYLTSAPANVFSKFNLSDIFEALSPADNDTLWGEIIRTAKKGAVVVYWTNLVQRSYPPHLANHIHTEETQLNKLRAKDRVFFYDAFHAHTIIK